MGEAKKTEPKKKVEKIIVTFLYCELLTQGVYTTLMKKEFSNRKLLYRIVRACDVIEREIKKYSELKQKIQEKYAKRDKNQEIVKTKTPQGEMIEIEDMKGFNEEIRELQQEEINTGFDKMEVDIEKDLPIINGAEMRFLTPFIIINE